MAEMNHYVFHFTGKTHQSFVMKDDAGSVVYEAICEKISLFKPTAYLFCDRVNGTETQKMVGHTKTVSLKINGFGGNIKSSFKLDEEEVWNVLEDLGYDFRFRLDGVHVCFDLEKNGCDAGTMRTAGTGAMDPKYKDSAVGKIPTNGIFEVCCAEEDIPALFLMCFAVTRTELAMNLMK